MNRHDAHPSTETLDRLRAGLLDAAPTEKAAVENHLQACEQCRQLYAWPATLNAEDLQLEQELSQARRTALAAASGRRPRQFLLVAAAAAIALVAVALVNIIPEPGQDDPQLAASDPDIPEVYEDPDFYLWLADHGDTDGPST